MVCSKIVEEIGLFGENHRLLASERTLFLELGYARETQDSLLMINRRVKEYNTFTFVNVLSTVRGKTKMMLSKWTFEIKHFTSYWNAL